MKYEIQIGQAIDLETKSVRPERTMSITKDQFDIIRCFANTKIGKNLETTYILNDCEFSVVPVIQMSDGHKKKYEDETVNGSYVIEYMQELIKGYYGIYSNCHESRDFFMKMTEFIKPKEIYNDVYKKSDVHGLADYFKELTRCK